MAGEAANAGQVTLTEVWCSRNSKHRFTVLNIAEKTSFKCPVCGCEHVLLDDEWFDVKILKLRADMAERKMKMKRK